MVQQAYVLITVEMGSEGEILEALKRIPEVREAHLVYGACDLIARVEADIFEEVKHAIACKIRRIDKVRSTLTLICIEDPGARERDGTGGG